MHKIRCSYKVFIYRTTIKVCCKITKSHCYMEKFLMNLWVGYIDINNFVVNKKRSTLKGRLLCCKSTSK